MEMGCGASTTAGTAEDDQRQDLEDEVLATDTSLAGIKVDHITYDY